MRTIAVIALLTATMWTPLGTWSGDGTRDTESFTTTQREWRVKWTQARMSTITAFSFTVVDAATDKPIASAGGTGDGETFVRATPGRFYLKISSANVKWTIAAEEQR